MRILASIFNLVIISLISSSGLAKDQDLLAARPNVLMTPTEITQLNESDRSRYLGEVRNLLIKAPENILLAVDNQCGDTHKQCEPSIFGEHICIPKQAEAGSECPKQIKIDKAFVPLFWSNYNHRVQNYCIDQKMPKICKELGERRVDLFMSRRTH